MRWRKKDIQQQQQQQMPSTEIKSDGMVHFGAGRLSSSAAVEGGAGVSGSSSEGRAKRACPVPKPGGLLGEWLGFHGDDKDAKPRR